MIFSFLWRVENIVGKGENAGYQKASLSGWLNIRIVGEKLYGIEMGVVDKTFNEKAAESVEQDQTASLAIHTSQKYIFGHKLWCKN